MQTFAWIFGVCAMLALFSVYQQKSRTRLIAAKLAADISWVAHYFCLGGYGGMVPNFVGIFRELVFMQRDKKRWAGSAAIPVLFILLNWGIGIFTFRAPINILPIAASTFVTISLWLRRPRLTKLISLPVSATFFLYDLAIGSYIGMLNESIAILSILLNFIIEGKRTMKEKSIFSPDTPTDKPEIHVEGVEITAPARRYEPSEVAPAAFARGDEFAAEIEARFVADFEKEGDQMVHVSTFALIGGVIYMTYYANTHSAAEDPNHQTARLVTCPENDPENKTFYDIQSVGDTCSGERVNLVYDTIFAQKDENTLLILWTAKVGDNYYRLYRPFDIPTCRLGEVGVNRLKIGDVTNDFSSTGIRAGLAANGIGCKRMYSDIGIMQKFTARTENGVTYYYTGAYSGDLNMLIKSRDFITWEYVSQPDFPNLSKWENAVYVLGDKCYYFVRQQDSTPYGFLTAYDLNTGKWEPPVLLDDCQSRSDFIFYRGELYLFHAPIDREHIGIVRINTENLAESETVLRAKMHTSCFYPFIQYLGGEELAMSYTVSRQHIRLARFTLSRYL